jgi:hypothetical protein
MARCSTISARSPVRVAVTVSGNSLDGDVSVEAEAEAEDQAVKLQAIAAATHAARISISRVAINLEQRRARRHHPPHVHSSAKRSVER